MQTTTSEPNGGLGRRVPSAGPAAATWVAGTGAFLLLAAAAVFIAVSWDRFPEAAKLALVGALTGGFLAGGRVLRRTLPATGDVLFHLGALLLPVDLAGLGLRASVGWRPLLLAEGVLGVTVLGGLGAASGSVVLAWAGVASMVALALGVASLTPLPAVVPLAGAALVAHLLRRRRESVAWSAVAALGPVLGFAIGNVVEGARLDGAGVLATLGLAGTPWALVGCVVAVVVLGREAAARHDLALAGLAAGGLVSGIVTTWARADVSTETTLVSLPAAFLAVQVVALLCNRDAFWRRLTGPAAQVAEAAAMVVGGFGTVILVLGGPFIDTGLDLFSNEPGWTPDPTLAASLAVLAVAWLAGALRRQDAGAPMAQAALSAVGHRATCPWFALAAVAAVAVGTASSVATAGALVVVAAVLVVAGGSVAAFMAAGLTLWAPVTAGYHPVAALVIGAAGVAVLALASSRSAVARPSAGRLLTAGAAGVAAAGSAFALPVLEPGGALIVFLLQLAALSAWVDQRDVVAGHVARTGMLGAAVVALALPAGHGVFPLALATLVLAADAVRLRRPDVAVVAAATVQGLLMALAGTAGFDLPETGLALVLAAVVWGGVAAVVDDEWREPFLAAAAMGVVMGLGLAWGDQRMLADSLIVAGGLAVAAGVGGRLAPIAHAGGLAATAGVLLHLEAAGVVPVEPYVVPVVLHLLVAGWAGRRRQVLSSWVAYGPAVALLGGTALAERLAGGPAWHSLVAGGVGLAAVAAGGWRRLAGPLFLGTGLLAAVTAVECVGALAGVPTWGWLAAGGTVLLAVGVALERADTSPVEAGRRLVDVISERFA